MITNGSLRSSLAVNGYKYDQNIVTTFFEQQRKSEGFDSCDRPSNLTQIGFQSSFFQPLWPWNLMDDPKKTIGHLSYATSKLCASFRSHWWIQTGVRVRKRPNLGQIWRFLEPCDLEIWRMTFKNNRAPLLCYFKLYAPFRSHWWIQTGVKSPETPNLGQIRRFLEPCDLEIWRMTFKNNRAPLLCYFKLYVSSRSHWWIQTGVRVRKRPIWVKFDAF